MASCMGIDVYKDTTSKGPKFSLSPGISEHTITGINLAFYRLANQIRWKHFRESRFQPSDFLTYPQSRHIYKPESEDELERKLQRIHHKLQTTLKELQPQRKWLNISHAEKKVIKELKEKNYICLPSDKGTEFCVIQQDTYTRVALAHLNDSSTYQKVPRMSAKTVENKVNSTWKKVCLWNEIPLFCPEELHRLKHQPTTSSRHTKLAQLLKYDLLYLTAMDQHSASHGCSPTPLNPY